MLLRIKSHPTLPMNRLIEDWFPKKYHAKKRAFSKFIPLHLAANYLQRDEFELYSEVMKSAFLHGVTLNEKTYLHPDEVLDRLTKDALALAKREVRKFSPSSKRLSPN